MNKQEVEDFMQETLKKRCNALELLLWWAIECGFGFDNFQDTYDKYADRLDETKSYSEQMIQLAEIYLEDGD